MASQWSLRGAYAALGFVIFVSACSQAPQTQLSTSTPTPASADSPTPVADQAATSIPSSLVCKDHECQQDGIDFNYLIVTRPLFVEALEPFVTWKTAQGLRVGLVTIEWLDATFSGDHLAERMKIGMHALRGEAAALYVLLVGDTEVPRDQFNVADVLDSFNLDRDWNVPTGYYRRQDEDPPGDVLPADIYFVEDRDWDVDGTGLNPVPDDFAAENGFNASLFLGRWPVRTPKDLENIVLKTMTVHPADEIFFTADSSLSKGAIYCPAWPPNLSDRFSCYLDTMGQVRQSLFGENAPWLSTESLFVDVNDFEATVAMREKMFASQGVIVGSYHGNTNCWMLGTACLPFGEVDFEYIFPMLEAEVCSISAFYSGNQDSFSEATLKRALGPAVISQAPNPYVFFQNLLAGQTVGEAFWRSGEVYVYWPNPMILLGDPSLVILETP